MRTILSLLSVMLFLGTNQLAHAIENQAENVSIASQNEALQASLDARNGFVSALKNREFTEVTRVAFDTAIQSMAETLVEEYQDQAAASELLARWRPSSLSFSRTLTFRLHNLGDHAPLFLWINTFFDKLAAKYGTIILTLPIVKNIQMLNYTIPVVFSPAGSWQTDGKNQDPEPGNRIEYRKHFIPFANLVTYYGVLYGCKAIVKKHGDDKQLKKLCAKAADKLRFVMGRYVAPVVSDWIFKIANRGRTEDLEITRQQLYYNSAEELGRAL